MARRNISIPDELNERLERLRDRVNASKVCAIALEKELGMIEGQTLAPDVDEAKVARLVERLQAQQGWKDRWYQRGRRDGETWAQETATLQDLRAFEESWSELDQVRVADFDPEDLEGWEDELPEAFQSNDLRRQPPELRGAYVLGWYASVQALWRVARTRL
ncbi:hypothetical protein ABN028_21745 [Actinopolymorpha sp. B17G11]|uniref:hypothetical protein n=1 Tax=Actinopolymorpha sp. B17G11 TaxID=3160861 RepID=UPI0032E3BAAE